ncbi:hypothetical protein FRC03_000580 [Tulasnella sp. 419]|nr:hypothetical protein FRC03_000580 [Tulasnella sp. 419]
MSDTDSLFGDADGESTTQTSMPLTLPAKGRPTGAEVTQRVGTSTLSKSPEPLTERTNATTEIFSSIVSSQTTHPSLHGSSQKRISPPPSTTTKQTPTMDADYEFPIVPERPKKRRKLDHSTPNSQPALDPAQKALTSQEIFIHALKTDRNVTSRLSELLIYLKTPVQDDMDGLSSSAIQQREEKTSELVRRLSKVLKTSLQKAANLSIRAMRTLAPDEVAGSAPPIAEIEASIWPWIMKISGISTLPSSSTPTSTSTSHVSLPVTPGMDQYDSFGQSDLFGIPNQLSMSGILTPWAESPGLELPSAGIDNSSLGLANDFGIWMLDFPDIQGILKGDQWAGVFNNNPLDLLDTNILTDPAVLVSSNLQDATQSTVPSYTNDPSCDMQIDPSLEDIILPSQPITSLSSSAQYPLITPSATTLPNESINLSQQGFFPLITLSADLLNIPTPNPHTSHSLDPQSAIDGTLLALEPSGPAEQPSEPQKSQKAKGKERAVDSIPLEGSTGDDSSGISAWRNNVAEFGLEGPVIDGQQVEPVQRDTQMSAPVVDPEGDGTEQDPIIVEDEASVPTASTASQAAPSPAIIKTQEFKKKAGDLVEQARTQKKLLEDALAKAQSVLWCLEVEHSVLGGVAKIAAKKEAELRASLSQTNGNDEDDEDEEMEAV